MEQRQYRETDIRGLSQDWQEIGSFFRIALHEVVQSYGDQDLSDRVIAAATSDNTPLNREALRLLEQAHPGSAELVLSRMEEIQFNAHRQELDLLAKSAPRRFGKAILNSLASLSSFR